MTTIIFRQDKKKNPNCDSSIDSNGLIAAYNASFAEGKISTVLRSKTGQARKSARGMPWH